jgi:hypothetical protein
MSTVEFGYLEDAPLRDAWAHEAHAFTPWLAENLDRISAAIGIPLEWEGTEVPVGRFSADILAVNPIDGSKVLIENQLEHGDHSHLGQILTYLTGLDARTVVWIAQDFREEHLSAIRWLNLHTETPYAFIAVKLRVVRIGASPYAPLFEVVERPNGWDRQVQEATKSVSTPSPLADQRRAFWDHYGSRYPAVAGYSRVGGGAAIWRPIPGTGLVISQFVSKTTVGVFVRGERGVDGLAVSPRLLEHAETLSSALGVEVGTSLYPLMKIEDISISDPADWDKAADWLHGESERYAAILADVFGQAP